MAGGDKTAAATPLLSSDRPLEDPSADLFGYAPFARALATSLVRECPADGLVIGLYGAWGTGKSTALNFLAHYLTELAEEEPPVILRFNPWWFSGQEDLLRRFFALFESAVFRERANRRKLKKTLAAFGSVFGAVVSELPVPGSKAIAKGVEKAAAAGQLGDVVELKAQLVSELRKAALKIVIIIDDIDRLVADEVRQMFRLIKAVADFPNVTYVLAFDREMTAGALEVFHPTGGRGYLDKIVQVPFELPVLDQDQLRTMLFLRLNRILGNLPEAAFDQRRWARVYTDSIQPFIVKPRDVVRLANALSVTYPAVTGEVNPIDLMAIETLRVLEPQAYAVIRDSPDQFAGTLDSGGSRSTEEVEGAKAFHDTWLKECGPRAEMFRQALQPLFPRLEALWARRHESDQSWRRELRVCSPEIFPIYFRLSVSQHSISKREFRAILDRAADAKSFGDRLLELVEQRRPDGTSRARVFLDRLNEHLREQKTSGVADAVTMLQALFEVSDRLVHKEGPARGLDFGIEPELQGAVRNLVELIPPGERMDILRGACSTGQALEQIADAVSLLAGQHGRHGQEAEPSNDRVLTEQGVVELEGAVGGRLAQLALTGAVWEMRWPLRVLFHWLRFEGRAPVAAWTRSLDAKGLARLLRLFVHEERASRTQLKLRLEAKALTDFFESAELLLRVEALLQSDDAPDSRPVLDLVAWHLRSIVPGQQPAVRSKADATMHGAPSVTD